MSDKGYSYKGHGTNSQGNHYCSRDYGSSASNPNSYHYSNRQALPSLWTHFFSMLTVIGRDGSYYYSNPNGSTYYNNGNGNSKYTSPSGQSYSGSNGRK
uniref:Uncharacterized protein n=1 Tax=Moniliophthora roreri TaxID=221103 RepID=A0A0W0FN49_MONRR